MRWIWESDKIFRVSTKDREGIGRLINERKWASESVFHLVEGLIRLREIEPSRVNLPDIRRELVTGVC